jgi:hypothetical protein
MCHLVGHKYTDWAPSYLIDGELISRMCARCLDVHVVWTQGDSLTGWHSRTGT